MLKNQKKIRNRQYRLPSKRVPKELYLYTFPNVEGLEDVTLKLNTSPAEDIFGALLHAFSLKPICNENAANEAERMIEYLGRAFEGKIPLEAEYYRHILLMLLKEYDDAHCVRANQNMSPQEFLKALLIEDDLTQKSLVPICFHSESQVSEFMHRKKGRDKLTYEQAVLLGNKFKVNPLNFLPSIL